MENEQTRTPLPRTMTLVREMFEVFKTHYKLLILISVVPLAVFMAIGILVAISLATVSSLDASLTILAPMVLALIVIIAIVIALWSQVALLVAIARRNEGLTFKQAFGIAKPLILPYFWVQALLSGVVMLGFAALIIPGILLSIALSLAFYIFIAEDVRGSKALALSYEYMRKRWWEVFVRWFGFGMLFLVFIIIFIIVLESITAVVGTSLISDLIETIMNIVLSPIYFIFGFLIYEHIKKNTPPITLAENAHKKFQIGGIVGIVLASILLIGSFVLIGIGLLDQDIGDPYDYYGIPEEFRSEEYSDINEQLIQDLESGI